MFGLIDFESKARERKERFKKYYFPLFGIAKKEREKGNLAGPTKNLIPPNMRGMVEKIMHFNQIT